MIINDLQAQYIEAGGGARDSLERAHPAGYPPISKDAVLAGARENPTICPPKNIPAIFSTDTAPSQLIIPRKFEPVQIFQPPGFTENPAHALRLAPKNFSEKISIDSPEDAHRLAQAIVEYFARPMSGWYEEHMFMPDGEERVVTKPYTAALPLLAEFANANGMTEAELKKLARSFPDTIGRALQFAKDVVKTHLIRGGISGEYNPQMTAFVATNETDMKAKTEHTERHVDVNDLLDRIERSSKPITYVE